MMMFSLIPISMMRALEVSKFISTMRFYGFVFVVLVTVFVAKHDQQVEGSLSVNDIINKRLQVLGEIYAEETKNTDDFVHNKGVLPKTEYYKHDAAKRPANKTALRRVSYFVDGAGLDPTTLIPELCTHIIFAFVAEVNSTLVPTSDAQVKRLKKFASLKLQHPDVNLMVSVGLLSDTVSEDSQRERFAVSIVKFLRAFELDGLDIDWEFPTYQLRYKERHEFTLLLQKIREAFTMDAKVRGTKSLILSVAVAAPKALIDRCYEVAQMGKYVDFVNVMCYDYHSWGFPHDIVTNHQSPLFRRKAEILYFGTENTAWSVTHWAEAGMPKDKIVVGIPAYSHTFTLLTEVWHGFYAPAIGPGKRGNFSDGPGTLIWPSICTMLKEGMVEVYDDQAQVPYGYRGDQWAGYENERSVGVKCNWLKSQGFGGAMMFSLNTDDSAAICDGKTKFPLHRAMYQALTSTGTTYS